MNELAQADHPAVLIVMAILAALTSSGMLAAAAAWLKAKARALEAEQAAEDLSGAMAEAGPDALPVVERLAELPPERKAVLRKTRERATERATTKLKKEGA